MPHTLPFVLLLVALGASAQPSPTEGRSFASWRAAWQEYDANAQNWSFAQRGDGQVYVANTGGILEYDGVGWRLYTTPNNSRALIRSLAVGRTDRLYIGGIGEVGYLTRDQTGTLGYQSLLDHIPADDRDFDDVWTTHATREGIVFQTASRLFRWDGRRMEVWRTETRFRSAFLVRGAVYVWEDGVGIKRLGARDLTLIPGGGAFASRKVDALLPNGDDLVALVRDEGLVSIRRTGASALVAGAASEYLVQNRPYTAVAMPDRYDGRGVLYAVGTFGGGVALVSPSGQLVRVYREDVGLTEGDQVTGLHADRQGGLWVALQNGIVRIDLFARHTWFESDVEGAGGGILGPVNAVAEHDGAVYAGTDSGVYRQVPGRLGRPGADGPAYARFESVPGTWQSAVWDLVATPQGLLVAANDGVHVLEGGRARRVWSGEDVAFMLIPIPGRADRMLVATKSGLVRLALRDGRWAEDGRLDGIDGEVRYWQEDAGGALWISQPGGDLYRIPDPGADRPRVEAYGPADGLSVAPGPLSQVGGRLLMSTREGVYHVERAGARIRLVRDTEFERLGGAYSLFALDDDDDLWTYSDGALRSPAAGFEMAGLQPNDLYRDRAGAVWIATADGLMRYDPTIPLGARAYPALVRRVTDRQGRVFFGGAFGETQDGADLVLDYDGGLGLRFEYAAALFDRPGRLEFSTRMLGTEDETWSAWGPERAVPYLGLREGTYTFEVRARDDMGHQSAVGRFTVRIRPPWYRTWWAYTLYLLAAIGFVWGITAWRLHKQRLRLEAIRARNARMQRLGARLQETNARLRRADKLKDDLLANTSHELRTPLTAVLGFSEILLDDVQGDQRDLAEGILRGGQRLLATVDGLLDMFKLQSGTLETFPQPLDATAVARAGVLALAPLAAARGLVLHVLPADLPLPATMDRGVLDRILTHLIGNAIKFTDEGEVTVLVDGTDREVVVTVRDTGVGIPADMTERVFEPFEQASTGFGRSHEGTGLGLAIVRRLVDLSGGTIAVESRVGEGTTVRVALPRWADVVAPSQRVVDTADNPALGGAQLLTLGVDGAAATLRTWVEPRGAVVETETTGQAIREAKKLAYDAVFVAAATAEAERKRVALVRNVPGYAHLPVLRVGGEALPQADLTARGFTHQLALPLVPADVLTLLEALLMTVEEAVDD